MKSLRTLNFDAVTSYFCEEDFGTMVLGSVTLP